VVVCGFQYNLGLNLLGSGRRQLKMLEGIAIGELTPSVLLGICVLLIFLGKLVPRSALQDKIDEAEKWRLAYETERDAHGIADEQTNRLLELANLSHDLIARMAGTSNGVSSSP
jgi:hypothetical protein